MTRAAALRKLKALFAVAAAGSGATAAERSTARALAARLMRRHRLRRRDLGEDAGPDQAASRSPGHAAGVPPWSAYVRTADGVHAWPWGWADIAADSGTASSTTSSGGGGFTVVFDI